MLTLRTEAFIRRTLAVCRFTGCLQLQSSSSVLNQSSTRHYRSQPTHGIGRYRHLLPKEEEPKKKGKLAMKEIKARTDFEFGAVNLQVSGYNMILVEHFSQYIHNFCNQLSVKVEESYANPTRTSEVMRLPEHGNKMFVDYVLTFHERIIQVSGLSSTLIPILLEVLVMNQPEGIHLLVKEHTEADYQARFKTRPDLENLVSSIG